MRLRVAAGLRIAANGFVMIPFDFRARSAPMLRMLTIVACTTAAVPAASEGCLFANSNGGAGTEGCSNDPLKLASRPAVIEARRALGLQKTPISFIGCQVASFSTKQGTGPTTRSYVIHYPILAAQSDDYIAPLTHELSHVLQSELAGGLGKFIETHPSSKQRELAADFLTGVVFGRASFRSNQRFQTNLELIGKFREFSANAHGTPAQRVAAFRMGVYLDFQAVGNDLGNANTEFLENRYANITSW